MPAQKNLFPSLDPGDLFMHTLLIAPPAHKEQAEDKIKDHEDPSHIS